MDCVNLSLAAENSSQEGIEDSRSSWAAENTKYYIMDIAVPCVCVLGLVGNLLSLMVLTTEKLHRTLTKMETSAHIGLIALAVSDFLFCLLVFVFTQACLKSHYDVGDSIIYFEFLANGLITYFIVSSTWLIVVMAAERYIAVCHPLRARKLISLRRTRVSVLLVFGVCALATIPIFLERQIVQARCPNGRTVYKLEERNQHSVKLRRVLWAIFFDFIPSAALVYFNLCLITQIGRAKKLRDRMTPKHTILRYTSSGTKTSAQLRSATPKGALIGQTTFTQRMNLKGRLHSGCTELTVSKDRHSHDHGPAKGVREYCKLNVSFNRREKSSRSSGGPTSQSSDNEFESLNDTHLGRGTGSSSSSSTNKVGIVTRRRPSDGALNSVTATLVAVVLLFLVLVSPSELMKFSVGYILADQEHKMVVTYVTNFMQVLNFSLNFLLYCVVNKTFRQTLHGLACCCWLTLQG